MTHAVARTNLPYTKIILIYLEIKALIQIQSLKCGYKLQDERLYEITFFYAEKTVLLSRSRVRGQAGNIIHCDENKLLFICGNICDRIFFGSIGNIFKLYSIIEFQSFSDTFKCRV